MRVDNRGGKKMKNYRHGDCALIGIEKIPEGLKAIKDKVLMQGSGGNNHSFSKGIFYPSEFKNLEKNIFRVGYLAADEGAKLYHSDHGCAKGGKLKEKSIEAGNYEVRRQVEDTHTGMKPVQD
jgi:hypothetical protein